MSKLAKAFARNLKAAREAKHMDGKELAARMGCVQSYVSMLERGERSPGLDTVEKAASVLKIDPLHLLRGAK